MNVKPEMKKNCTVMLSLLLSLLFAFSALAGAPGDVDDDGGVTAADARAALRIAVSLEKAEAGSAAFTAADVDGDGRVTAADARMILRAAVGLEVLGRISPAPTDGVLTRRQVYDMAAGFTVEIESRRDDGVALGSGFFISEDGKLLTNYHVISDTNALTVRDYNGNVYEVDRVLGFDRKIDIALLQVKGNVPAWATLNKNDYSTADTVYALGSSNGYTGSFSEGMISTAKRPLEGYSDVIYIQHTAAISQGNSGGPLLDDRGRVIGLNTLGDDDGNSLYFAVPVSYLDSLDLSAPMTVEAFSEAEYNFKEIYFAEAYGNETLRRGAVGVYGFGAYSRTASSVSVDCDSAALEVSLGNLGSYFYGLFVVAKDVCENVPVTLYMEDAPEIRATLYVTVTGDAGMNSGGVLSDVPDFGAVTGIAPSMLQTNNGSILPTFVYRDRAAFASQSADALHAAYDAALTAAGFTLNESQTTLLRSTTTYAYVNPTLGVTVLCTEVRVLGRMQMVSVSVG